MYFGPKRFLSQCARYFGLVLFKVIGTVKFHWCFLSYLMCESTSVVEFVLMLFHIYFTCL